jgi:hypothetical protein
MSAKRVLPPLLLLLLVIAGCKPDGRTAKRELQAFLDKSYPGVWRVDSVERINGREVVFEGAPTYLMEARVRVTILRPLKPSSLRDAVSALRSLFSGETWLVDLVGSVGEQKTAVMNLAFVKTDNGWLFRGPCSECP